MTPTESPCPCGSSKTLSGCCGPYLQGASEAPNAEALMRSRYTAFVRGDADYLWRTLHSSHDDVGRGRDAYCQGVIDNHPKVRFGGLEVLDTEAPDRDGLAQVLFGATLEVSGQDGSFIELSGFAKEDGGWRYLMGATLPRSEVSNEVKTCSAFRKLLECR